MQKGYGHRVIGPDLEERLKEGARKMGNIIADIITDDGTGIVAYYTDRDRKEIVIHRGRASIYLATEDARELANALTRALF